ncbi:TetR/AcrR family transcriptional regulator [Sphingomonas oligophenolica]|uniref:TetR/AcrR family transcriptional regulator n=1 Tax=Sphingomonas oligophenolica TaxID=301154 RepID=A0ABU9YAZ1_9SPHN
MARTQAADFEQRREAIVATAAKLYAARGFLGASMAEIAAACKTSKSLIYHYYPSKEDILFDVMDSHVQSLVEAARAIETGNNPADARIRSIALALMRLYAGAEANQKVLLNELGNLPAERRAIIIDHQRQLLDVMDRLLLEVRSDLSGDKPRRRALVMMFFGMLNFTHTWFDQNGPIRGSEIAMMAAEMFLAGLAPQGTRKKQKTPKI